MRLPETPARARTHGWLFVLADGVGGNEKGEVASQAAVESMIAGFRKAKDGESHAALVPRLVQQANAHVFETAVAGGRDSAGMATTMVACALRFDRVTVAHAGDSRCYLIRNGTATLLTRDHTVANEQVRLGLVSTHEAAESSTRHILKPVARHRANRQRRDKRSSSIPRAMSCCCARMVCMVRWKVRKWRRYAAMVWTCSRWRKNWWRLPMIGAAAIISAFKSSVSETSNAWVCTAADHTNSTDAGVRCGSFYF